MKKKKNSDKELGLGVETPENMDSVSHSKINSIQFYSCFIKFSVFLGPLIFCICRVYILYKKKAQGMHPRN